MRLPRLSYNVTVTAAVAGVLIEDAQILIKAVASRSLGKIPRILGAGHTGDNGLRVTIDAEGKRAIDGELHIGNDLRREGRRGRSAFTSIV